MHDEMCRACLSAGDDLLQFEKLCIDNYYVLTNISVTKVDGLPQHICCTCKTLVDNFITFRTKCLESENVLNSRINTPEKQECISEIKLECNLECDPWSNVDLSSNEHNFVNEEPVTEKYVKIEEIPVETITAEPIEIKKQKVEVPKAKVKCKKTKNLTGNLKLKQKNSKDTRISKEKQEVYKNDFYMCGLCPREIADKPALLEHIDQHLKSSSPCEICSEQFTEWQEKASHRYVHIEVEHMVCHLCDKRFKSGGTQENHYYKAHSEKGRRGPKKQRRYRKDLDKRYVCDECQKAFKSKQKLTTHLAVHRPREQLPCPDCGKLFSSNTSLKFHRKTLHSTVGEYCSFCQKRVPSLAEHHCARRGVCTICGKRVASHFMPRHMLTHTSERPYKCSECGNTYRWQSSLDGHVNKHRGRRPHACPSCPAAFYTLNVLLRHIRTHTGERPYVCEICGKGFTGSHNRKMHMKVHGLSIVTKKGIQEAAKAVNFFADSYTAPALPNSLVENSS